MTKWHPATKFLLLAAIPVLAYLLWSGGDAPAPAVVGSVVRPQPAEPEPSQPTATEPAPAFQLPPLEHFTAVVERPLFSPTRRMPVLSAPNDAPAPRVDTGPAAPSGPDEPPLRFFGTERRDGTAAALVVFSDTGKVGRLVPGDMVGEWQVLSVESNRLLLGQGDEQRTFELFGPGARGKPAAPGAAPAPAPPGTDGAAPDGSAAPEDDSSSDYMTAPDQGDVPDDGTPSDGPESGGIEPPDLGQSQP